MKHLILGGARSGKSRHAEALAIASGRPLLYVATSQALDEEMSARIKIHQQRRGSSWKLIEEPLQLAKSLLEHSAADSCLLVDCLTLWVSNCLIEECWEQERYALFECIDDLPGELLLVSNEVGQGIVPMGELSRRFVDESGRLHQELAQRCDKVTMLVAGLPQQLK